MAWFGPALSSVVSIQKSSSVIVRTGQSTSSTSTGKSNAEVKPSEPIQFSAGIADVLLLVNADVGVEIIKAFIQNSAVAYQPSAAEIIVLKARGISTEIIIALLQRGAELRSQRELRLANAMARLATTANAPAPTSGYPTASQQPSVPEAVYPGYGANLAPVTYPVYNYSYWWSTFGYPAVWFYPSVHGYRHRGLRHSPHWVYRHPGLHFKGRYPAHWAVHQNRNPWSPASAFSRPRFAHHSVGGSSQPPRFLPGPHWGANRNSHPPRTLPGPHWGADRGSVNGFRRNH